ncbi:MAG: isoamylase [Treponema sp.]|nr:isoamylase [Treponema sp.]
MRKLCFLGIILSLFISCSQAQKETIVPDPDAMATYEYADIAATIRSVSEPYLKGDYVIFTQKNTARYIGIAFDFEKYRTIHKFQIKQFRDEEYEVEDSIYFYILKLPKNVQELNYRLVVDGLWTTDPENPITEYNEEADLMLSQLDVSRNIPLVTEKKEDGLIHFVYLGESGQQIRLGGSFTNWDSWIYQLEEVTPGVYQIALSLPPGTYDYAYYTGVTSFPDRTNTQRSYSPEGKVASRLVIE